MSSSDALDQVAGKIVGTLPNGTEYRQALLSPTPGEKHVTPDGRVWEAVQKIVDGKVIQSAFTIHWRGSSTTIPATHFHMTTLFVQPKGLFLEGNGGVIPITRWAAPASCRLRPTLPARFGRLFHCRTVSSN